MTRVLRYRELALKWERIPRFRGFRILIPSNGTVILRSGVGANSDEALTFVRDKEEWIRRAVATQLAQIPERGPRVPRLYRAGEQFHYLGKELSLRFLKSDQQRAHVWPSGSFLFIEVPEREWDARMESHPFNEYEDAVISFYRREAEQFLPPRVMAHAQRLGDRPRRVTIRGQTTRWGSCSAQRTISLNWKLMAAPLEVVDYVIIHELCHLRHMDHSRRFWDCVATFFPHYREARKWLQQHAHDFDFLNKLSNLYVSKLS